VFTSFVTDGWTDKRTNVQLGSIIRAPASLAWRARLVHHWTSYGNTVGTSGVKDDTLYVDFSIKRKELETNFVSSGRGSRFLTAHQHKKRPFSAIQSKKKSGKLMEILNNV